MMHRPSWNSSFARRMLSVEPKRNPRRKSSRISQGLNSRAKASSSPDVSRPSDPSSRGRNVPMTSSPWRMSTPPSVMSGQ